MVKIELYNLSMLPHNFINGLLISFLVAGQEQIYKFLARRWKLDCSFYLLFPLIKQAPSLKSFEGTHANKFTQSDI